ncbi:MAG: PH domain-containing protein [Sandaracinaceae bacterium]|nr:PH domain-containing protein [Sandaracinaceae bacterium]
MTTCPECGAELRDASPRFCSSCGATLGAPERKPGARSGPSAGATDERVLFDGRPAMVGSAGALLVAILTIGLALLYFWMRSLGRHYRITTGRVVIEHGLFSKRMEQIDLYRVTDYVVERPFGQRLLGTGNLVLVTQDRTTPEIRVEGIRADVRALYEELRAATEAEKRRRGVRMLDVE